MLCWAVLFVPMESSGGGESDMVGVMLKPVGEGRREEGYGEQGSGQDWPVVPNRTVLEQ